MTIRTETRYFVVCNDCGTEHHRPDDDSAMAARISVGMDGWKHVSGKPGRAGKGTRPAADVCAACVAKAERAVAEAQR